MPGGRYAVKASAFENLIADFLHRIWVNDKIGSKGKPNVIKNDRPESQSGRIKHAFAIDFHSDRKKKFSQRGVVSIDENLKKHADDEAGNDLWNHRNGTNRLMQKAFFEDHIGENKIKRHTYDQIDQIHLDGIAKGAAQGGIFAEKALNKGFEIVEANERTAAITSDSRFSEGHDKRIEIDAKIINNEKEKGVNEEGSNEKVFLGLSGPFLILGYYKCLHAAFHKPPYFSTLIYFFISATREVHFTSE